MTRQRHRIPAARATRAASNCSQDRRRSAPALAPQESVRRPSAKTWCAPIFGALTQQPLLRGPSAGDAEMPEGRRRCAAAARGARDEARFEQVRLDDVFERLGVFGERCGDRRDARGAAAILLDDRPQKGAVEAIEPELVDALALQRLVGDRAVMRPSARTSAKSRTRRSSRFATRGVPRLRARDRLRPLRSRSARRERSPSGARSAPVPSRCSNRDDGRCRSARAAAPSACPRASSHRRG